eukprot:TRINITY_DN3234_c1_g2_i1.p1 TRINITY_DN3234_c1_g2~~TRINITY_DN3234_c1_g2_i1.p1  ORF type:complete len:1425 (-),score=307.17 TRINITY_DN3234_c1_g2_i1:99-4373(-)
MQSRRPGLRLSLGSGGVAGAIKAAAAGRAEAKARRDGDGEAVAAAVAAAAAARGSEVAAPPTRAAPKEVDRPAPADAPVSEPTRAWEQTQTWEETQRWEPTSAWNPTPAWDSASAWQPVEAWEPIPASEESAQAESAPHSAEEAPIPAWMQWARATLAQASADGDPPAMEQAQELPAPSSKQTAKALPSRRLTPASASAAPSAKQPAHAAPTQAAVDDAPAQAEKPAKPSLLRLAAPKRVGKRPRPLDSRADVASTADVPDAAQVPEASPEAPAEPEAAAGKPAKRRASQLQGFDMASFIQKEKQSTQAVEDRLAGKGKGSLPMSVIARLSGGKKPLPQAPASSQAAQVEKMRAKDPETAARMEKAFACRKELGVAVQNAAKASPGNVEPLIDALYAFRATEMPEAARDRIGDLLDVAVETGTPELYAETVALCGQLRPALDARFFAKLLVRLSSRMPMPISSLRLTLNLAIPPDMAALPLRSPNEGWDDWKRRGETEDGEQDAAEDEAEDDGTGVASLAKAKAAPKMHRDTTPEIDVNPESLRGCVRCGDAAMTRYFGHFVSLLNLEMLEEYQSMVQRLENRSLADLTRQGWTLQHLRLKSVKSETVGKHSKSASSLPGRKVTSRQRIVFSLPHARNLDLSTLRFRPGDSVLLSRSSPLEDCIAEGLVADITTSEGNQNQFGGGGRGAQIIVSIEGAVAEEELAEGDWRLDRGLNRTAFQRQLMALVRLAFSSTQTPVWKCLLATPVGDKFVDDWAAHCSRSRDGENAGEQQPKRLRGSLAGSHRLRHSLDTEARGPEELARLSGEEPGDLSISAADTLAECVTEVQQEDPSFPLNESQRAAVAGALQRRLTLVQGPPGTGKTHVSVRLLEMWSRIDGLKPLLATSDSNIAVDNIAEGCLKRGLKVLRLGRPEKVSAPLEAVTLEALLRDTDWSWWYDGADFGEQDADKSRRQNDFAAKMDILSEADVICTTTVASGTDFLQKLDFGAILVDEVAQATETSALVPIVLRQANRLVLVGDHCQLPPSVASWEAQSRGLSLSLFGRLVAPGSVEPYFLDTQFRMHPLIAAFSAREFYDGRLNTGVQATERWPPAGFAWPRESAGVAFVNCDGYERRDGDSRANDEEAELVAHIVQTVLAAGELRPSEIGVVSPYSAQVRNLRQVLRQNDTLAGCKGGGWQQGDSDARSLEIASVDAFQGREKELIVFSATRSNNWGSVGFLADWRRLNVMITRARRGLIVIGNAHTLRNNSTWNRWLRWAEASRFLAEVPDYPGGRSGWNATWSTSSGSAASSSAAAVAQPRPKAAPTLLGGQLRGFTPALASGSNGVGVVARTPLQTDATAAFQAFGGCWAQPSGKGCGRPFITSLPDPRFVGTEGESEGKGKKEGSVFTSVPSKAVKAAPALRGSLLSRQVKPSWGQLRPSLF